MNPVLIGIDPLFLTNVKLIIKDILELKRVQETPIELFYLYNHVVKFVEICGTVVGVERGRTSTTYTVDDSTGTIACNHWDQTLNADYKPIEIGTTVRCDGKITTFRDERQISIYDIYPLNDPNQELAHLVHAILLKDEYKKKFKLPLEIELHSKAITKQFQHENSGKIVLDTQQSTNISDEAFENALLNYCQHYYPGDFSSTSYREVQHLKEMAEQLVIERSNTGTASNRQISEQFSLGLTHLLEKGLVMPSTNNSSLYKVVDELRLAKFIVKIISDALNQTSHQQAGIRIEYILTKVAEEKEFEWFGTYPRKIYDILNSLADRGIVYPTGKNEYKVLTL